MGFLGSIGTAIKSGAQTAVGVAPYAARMIAENEARDRAATQLALKNQYEKEANDRANAMLKLAQENGAVKQEGQWGNAFSAEDENGPGMFQQHKITGEVRRVNVSDGAPKSPGTPINASPKSTAPSPTTPLPGDSQDMAGDSEQAPVQQTASATQTPTAPKPRTLKPYVKPTAEKPASTIPGTPEWRQAQIDKAKIGAQFGYHAPQQPSFTAFQGTDQQGNPVVRPFNTKTGEFGPAADVMPKGTTLGANGKPLAAPMAAKVGQAGEMLKKAADLLPMMEGLGVSLGQSAASDVASHGIGVGGLRVPGTKGLGNMLMNNTPAYAQYQAALNPFILAAAHALSGARINQDQVEQIRKSIELAPGDINNPQVVEQKRKNVLDLVNSITGSLPPDAIASQESQIDEKALRALEGYGYKRTKTAGASPTTGTPAASSKAPTPKTSTKAPAKDYGIFGKPSGDEE